MLSEIKVVSRNCANNVINPALYGGLIENKPIQEIDILFHQEVPMNTFSKFTNARYCLKKDDEKDECGYISFLTIDGKKCGVMAHNVGMSSPSKGVKRIPKVEAHGTVLVWNNSLFRFLWSRKPTYMDTSLIHGLSEIGIRSTPWIAVEHVVTKKKFVLISVHANAGNETKRSKLLCSIFNDAHIFEKSNLCSIIAGDFNEKPDMLFGYLKTNLRTSWINGTTDVTHINTNTKFVGYIDYIFSSGYIKKDNVVINGINQNAQTMSGVMQQSQNDHAVISQKFYL